MLRGSDQNCVRATNLLLEFLYDLGQVVLKILIMQG